MDDTEISDREVALDQAVKLNIARGHITAPFPTGADVVVDAEAMLRFLRGQKPVEADADALDNAEETEVPDDIAELVENDADAEDQA